MIKTEQLNLTVNINITEQYQIDALMDFIKRNPSYTIDGAIERLFESGLYDWIKVRKEIMASS